MRRLLLVSNRLPITVHKRKGELHFKHSVGGLATALGSFYKSYNCLWIGWPGISLERIEGKQKEIQAGLMCESCYPVFLSQQDIEDYYHGFSNRTIWLLFHYLTFYTVYREDLWQAYQRVNQAFSKAITKVAQPDDLIWIHDYHLMLLPRLLREKFPRASIGFFLHIPFPSFEIFRLLPWRKEILDGLLGADLVGFHTYEYMGHFCASLRRLFGYEVALGQILTKDRIVKAEVFPLGIDYEHFSTAVRDTRTKAEITKFRKRLKGHQVILSIDRLDYTKGIPQRLKAVDTFLERNPEYKERLTFIMVIVPSRTEVGDYISLKRQVDELVGAINGKHGTIGWVPIWYLHHSLPFHSLVALYNIADIALVTPIRDGMNLVAKEYLATKRDGKGVLILSETAGAAKELGEAITINVNNEDELVEALEKALAMPEKEQIEHNRTMQRRLQRYTARRWAEEFIESLLSTRKLQQEMEARELSDGARGELISQFQKSQGRLLFLDYDGTLIPFSEKPEEAKPGKELIKLLQELADNPKNEVVLISGRDKETLEKWFGGLKIGLVAEHGAKIKERGKEWQTEALRSDWKEQLRPILELWVDRTPGSFIEEKDYSLVWHYRKADPELGELRAREIKSNLSGLSVNLDLHVLEGNKVIEVKNASIDKGRAASRWISREEWDFIMAIGDDRTDEDLFKALPPTAWSFKVGFSASTAKFNLTSPSEAIALLRELVGGDVSDRRATSGTRI